MAQAFSVAIVRIVGNELPPRHQPGSSLEQLRFILAHEPCDKDVKKIWVLNRIVDPALQASLVAELEKHGCSYISLPFDLAAYKETRFGFWSRMHKKAGAIIAINRARNVAMEEGAKVARWVIPLDGGCCFDAAGFADMLNKAQSPAQPAYAFPTYRLRDNSEYFTGDFKHSAMHEAMLMLQNSMKQPFEEDRPYGDSDKLATIRRLFPASALKQTRYATVVNDPAYHAGYVVRLSSGTPQAEAHHRQRVKLRAQGLAHLVRRVESMLKTQ